MPCGGVWWDLVAFYLLLLAGVNVQGVEGSPEGMSFVGLEQERWGLYIVTPGTSAPQIVTTALEPRTPTYNPRTGKVAYIGADGSLREIMLDNATERVLLHADTKRTFTQPAYDAEGKRLFVVVLKNRESVETEIVAFDGAKPRPVVSQRSAQFEPYFHAPDLLYYANVLCTIGCGRIIQEIWRINLVSGVAGQVTLLNVMARQPVVSPDGKWLVFSSDKAGNFHIWRMDVKIRRYEQLTTGQVTDISPALDRNGQVYFIRHTPDGTQLMRWRADGEVRPLPLPNGVEDLRDLEIHP